MGNSLMGSDSVVASDGPREGSSRRMPTVIRAIEAAKVGGRKEKAFIPRTCSR
jgi:hypothetical protein